MILSYYWPPSGGSGVQRWVYFTKYLKQMGWEPYVVTVDEKQASYPVLDFELLEEVKGVHVVKTDTKEPLKIYSKFISGSLNAGIPQGQVPKQGWMSKMAAFIRGNFFIPDARKGWNYYAKRAAEKILKSEGIKKVITTGPPHSTHLVGSFLKTKYGIQWWADFRDPWVDIFYNKQLYRSYFAQRIDAYFEKKTLRNADGILTTVGGNLIKKFKIKAPDQSFHVLPNGYDAAMMSAVSRTTVNPFHVVYTGLLTENQDYIPVIKALSALSENGKVLFSLAGNISAAQIDKIKKLAPKVTVEYKGYLSHRDAVGLMKSGDLLLNFIFKGADQDMVSGKLLEYLACGVPVLSIGAPQSEAGRLLAGSSFSKMVKASDGDAIKSFLLKAFQNKGKVVNEFPALKKWSRQALTVDLATVLMKES